MSAEAETPREPGWPVRRLDRVRDQMNPATVQGGIAVLAGLFVLGLPGVSSLTIGLILGVAMLGLGATDLWYAVTGRGWTVARSRVRGLLRAPFALVFAALLFIEPRLSTNVLFGLIGVYVGFRGVLLVLRALFGGAADHRGSRLALGSGALAVGFLSFEVPETLSKGIFAIGAVTAIIVGLVLISYGLGTAARSDTSKVSATAILWDFVRGEDVGPRRRDDLADTLYFEQPGRRGKLTAWWVMLLLSAAIASFAILQDSTAVVIGAMLIAPLMQPILGLAGALVNGWSRRAVASVRLVTLGSAAAIALSASLTRWVPALIGLDVNSQITSRTHPTLIDMLIALCAGAAGAFATVNARVASSIAGVAIAVALVPPLSVVGILLSAGMYSDASGAFLLFLTNFIAIVLSASLVFVLGGFADTSLLRRRSRSLLVTMTPFAALALIILVPLVFTSEGIVNDATRQREATSEVHTWLGPDPTFTVVRVSVDGDRVRVDLTGSKPLPPVTTLQQSLTASLGVPTSVTVEYTPTQVVEVDANGA